MRAPLLVNMLERKNEDYMTPAVLFSSVLLIMKLLLITASFNYIVNNAAINDNKF